jgi:hypothetical protein
MRPISHAVVAGACCVLLASCGDDGSTPANTRGQEDASSAARASTSSPSGDVATSCPNASDLNVPGTFDFRVAEAPAPEEKETLLSCAYRSGPEQGDGQQPTSLITFVIGDYGDGVDQNFDAVVSLAECSESDDIDPANCTTDIDEQHSRYERSDESLEAIEVDEPLGDIAPNPANRFGTFSAAHKNGSKVCATSAVQQTTVADDPDALVTLGEKVIAMIRKACGK